MPAIVGVKTAPELIQQARDRWVKCDEAETTQRERIVRAKQFRSGEQWPPEIKMQRKGGASAIQGVPEMPARPCLTIDRLSQPCRQVSNQIKTANFSIDVLPNGFGADTDTANIFKGYLRYVQNRARGESPIEWAADQAIEGGIGWFRIRTEYVYDDPEGVPPDALMDQELRLERITNNLTVYCDPWSLKPTRSDAQFMFVTEDLSREEFKHRYPKADLRGLEDFASSGDKPVGWVGVDSIRVAEYWRITYKDETVQTPDGRTRVFRIPAVKMSKITATEELEHYDWVGSRIPLVPILGEEFNIDGRVFLRGLIEPGMDAQRMVNYTYSGAVEIFALGSKSQYVAADDQVADYKGIWQTANTINWAYLPYKPLSVSGTLLPPPQRDTSEAPIQAAALLLQVSEDGIKATTGWYDSGLGANTQRTLSGRAKQSEIQQSELGSSNYPDNVRRALIYAGELMVEIAPKITRPGQLLQIIGADDQPEQVVLGQEFIQQEGRAMPVSPEQAQGLDPKLVKFYDFSAGRYAVTVAVGKSNATKREEGAAALGELIPNLPPPQAAVLAPEYVEQLSFEGSHKAAELMRQALPPELQPKKEGEQEDPRLMQMQQQLMQAQQIIESKQIEEQTKQQAETQRVQMKEQATTDRDLQKAQLDAQISREKAQMDAATKIKLADTDADVQLALQAMRNAATIAAAHISANAKGAALDAHAAEEAQALGHEAEQADLDRQQESELTARQHQQALEQAEQSAAMQPPEAGA
jgi:hypothetical protein